MQFVANGPDIPDELLRAHEEGRVVFFCGSGISRPANLPDFSGLVDEIYRRLGTDSVGYPIEAETFKQKQFDATLDLLEKRLPGARDAARISVRKQLVDSLQPNLRMKGAIDTHVALIQLASGRDDSLKLVTTNFDRLFEIAAVRMKKRLKAYSAPMLPIPKHSGWDGLVYLHGLIPKSTDDAALHRLVLTSGDFGLAYLTERWAARFVSELFRNYVVCFVGYSIADPVLRYMMDALAADRRFGNLTPQPYAFGDCDADGSNAARRIAEWEAKGVTPILYDKPPNVHDHSLIHRTLKVWAETFRDGVLGKEAVVLQNALVHPTASTRQDDFVGRMVWALSDRSGLPAKRLAEFNPVPTLDWLAHFAADRYGHRNLIQFGVAPVENEDTQLSFGLVRRPAPYGLSPWMQLVSTSRDDRRWDVVMLQLGRWLIRHLNDPVLIIWLARQGATLHGQFKVLIENQLTEIARLERANDSAALDKLRADAANAIPTVPMRTLWRLLLSGRVKSPGLDLDLYDWKNRVLRDGLTASLRIEFRELLAPKLKISSPLRWPPGEDNTEGPPSIRQIVDIELVLASDFVSSFRDDHSKLDWEGMLPMLVVDIQQLLLDALDLLHELGEADAFRDRSYWALPSIEPHHQNGSFREWTTLIEFLRDAWLATNRTDSETAARIALGWFAIPYPTFKRLAFFAVSRDASIPGSTWITRLLNDDAQWLWSLETHREVMRLLVLQSANLGKTDRAELEAAIVTGPLREAYRQDLVEEEWRSLADRAIWLRLTKLQQGVGSLGDAAERRLVELSAANPMWKPSGDERDEFLMWTSGTGDPDFEASRPKTVVPRDLDELAAWLKLPPDAESEYYDDPWPHFCRTDTALSIAGMQAVARDDVWPIVRWSAALSAWSEDSIVNQAWDAIAPVILAAPDAVLQSIVHQLSWWIEVAAKSISRHQDITLLLSRRILGWQHASVSDPARAVSVAINHPVGHVTTALLNLWFKGAPNDNDSLPDDIRELFTQLCDTNVENFVHGRVVLASQIVALYRVDQAWTDAFLLPRFDWERGISEAAAVWQGFLWSPRLYQPLLIAMKSNALATASHYGELGEQRDQYASFLTYAALLPAETYHPADFRRALECLPQEGLDEVARALAQALGATGEQREEYWKNRVRPFWQEIWPQSRDFESDTIAEYLSRLCIAANAQFPTALDTVINWLRPIEHPGRIVQPLFASQLVPRFPEAALRMLNAVIADQDFPPSQLRDCLDAIAAADPHLAERREFRRLDEYLRRHDR